MRPSGRKAIRQGSSKVATVVILKGWVASGFCSPTLTWPQAAAAQVRSVAVLANFIFTLLTNFKKKSRTQLDDGREKHPSAPKLPNRAKRLAELHHDRS